LEDVNSLNGSQLPFVKKKSPKYIYYAYFIFN
jgi:hypothetical protein